MFIVVFIAFVGIDRLTKYLIDSNMQLGEIRPVIGNLLQLNYVRNNGAAFSILQGKQTMLICFTVVVMVVITVYYFINRKKLAKAEAVSLALIVSGGVGNLICRIRNGYVIDFIDISVIPVFNVADIAVTCGCILLILYVLFFDRKNDGK